VRTVTLLVNTQKPKNYKTILKKAKKRKIQTYLFISTVLLFASGLKRSASGLISAV